MHESSGKLAVPKVYLRLVFRSWQEEHQQRSVATVDQGGLVMGGSLLVVSKVVGVVVSL